jgi:hypothetical protein
MEVEGKGRFQLVNSGAGYEGQGGTKKVRRHSRKEVINGSGPQGLLEVESRIYQSEIRE